MFCGRKKEISLLNSLKKKNSASLVCVLGRRRVGKSSLIEYFGQSFKSFFEIQGLGPDLKATNQDQLDHFSHKLSLFFNTRKEHFSNWTEAFECLAKHTRNGEILILLDEISWMGGTDPLFAVKLKEVWDTQLKKNPKLVLICCGSVSTWIETNILNSTSFVGRVSLSLNLEPLSLPEANLFWSNHKQQMSSLEKLIILSVTGGIPKYLEEVLASETAQKNLIRICFDPSGLLYNEFKHIFRDIFNRKSKTLEKIIRACLDKKLSPKERSTSKLSHLRVKDNYLRFYLKHIEPLKPKIEKGGKKIKSLYDLPAFESLMGFQLENLILANRELLYPKLNITDQNVISSAPYVQRKKLSNKGACQIDLLIHTQLDVFYLCEIKCRKVIDKDVIKEIDKKVKVLQLPKRSSIKTVLIYEGEPFPSQKEELDKYFFKIIHFGELLN